MTGDGEKYSKYLFTLSDVGIALSAEKDHAQLLKKIVSGAMKLTNSDACTLYLLDKNQTQLNFQIFANNTLKISPTKIDPLEFPVTAIQLYNDNGEANLKNIVSYCYFKAVTQHIEDAYQTPHFDFSGTHAIDKKFNYHSKSFLTIPLRNHENKMLGILELINTLNEETGEIATFDSDKIHLAESFASFAATELTKQELIQAQKNMFESLLKLIAKAIDEKSTYTSNHCIHVPIIAELIANAVNSTSAEPFKNFHFTKEELEELSIAAWLHDCGKIATPEHIINKSTKLEILSDGINSVLLRLELIKKDLQIAALEKQLQTTVDKSVTNLQPALQELDQVKEFLIKVNKGGEMLSESETQKIKDIASKHYFINHTQQPLLTDTEVTNLCVARGTLNQTERKVIQDHAAITKNILQTMTYPEYLKNVPEIAGNHHEHVNGKGYPRGLSRKNMSLQSRIVAIADIFEALTASDRPYKKPNSLSEALKIMVNMKENGHIDGDLLDLFINEKIYLEYAKKYLKPEQIDV